MSTSQLESIQFGADGLVPVVVQDVVTGDVLMLAWMNDEALRLTSATGKVHYWSRSRNKLWRKGETSGHTQTVSEIRINCERNCLLLFVRQVGAVCHDGYPTCYYRRVADDGSLTVVREQAFDPAIVYGPQDTDTQGGQRSQIDTLAEATRRQFGAYAYLRDNDLVKVSRTSASLRNPEADIASRIADELRELAGVLEGEHRHCDRQSDVLLEASQVIYWALLATVREGVTWARLRPDRALGNGSETMEPAVVARMLRADAERWGAEHSQGTDVAAAAHATLHLVAEACRSNGLDPLAAVTSDLHDLQSRPYLAAHFAGGEKSDARNRSDKRSSAP